MTTIKHILLSLLILCNVTLVYGKATTQSDSPQTVTAETTSQLKPIDIIKNPNILSDKWLDEPIPISQYTDEEKHLQTLINDKTATAVKTYSTSAQDKEWVKYDHEAITPYTWKIIDIALTEANGKTNNVSLLRPNWWIRNIGADRLGNRFYLKIPEVAEGDAIVKAIRVNQLDTRLWDEQRNGDYVYRPITATFQHDSNNVFNLYFANDEKPLGVTPEHPIYSMDKNKFVHAGDLTIGEKVKTYQGISTLVKKEKLEGTHKVYNVEVYRDHNYMVSMNSILVHNKGGNGQNINVFELRTPEAYNAAQDVKTVMSASVDSKGRPLFSQSKNQTIQVLTHEDGTVSVGISGATPQKVSDLQRELDNAYGSGKYYVQPNTLSEADGLIRPSQNGQPIGNPIGKCAEPNCAVTASKNPSPITGSSTVWRGKGENKHPVSGGQPDEMIFCETCNANKQIYNDVATGKK